MPTWKTHYFPSLETQKIGYAPMFSRYTSAVLVQLRLMSMFPGQLLAGARNRRGIVCGKREARENDRGQKRLWPTRRALLVRCCVFRCENFPECQTSQEKQTVVLFSFVSLSLPSTAALSVVLLGVFLCCGDLFLYFFTFFWNPVASEATKHACKQ